MLCFPEVQEVHLRRSPLAEVICQVRFPALLRIVSQNPVEFQDGVRHQFPLLVAEQGLALEGSPSPTEQPALRLEPRLYRFRTSDEATTISLSADFVSLSTTTYQHWDDFAEFLRLAVDTLQTVYEPGYARRLGLRYINRLTYENTGARIADELLAIVRPSMVAWLQDECWGEPPAMDSKLLLPAGADENLTLHTGFEGGEQPTLVLDFDYFGEGQIPLADVLPRCRRYHEAIYRVFRWCILEHKLAVFDPVI